MSNVVKHSFQSGVSDGADSSLVRPSNWNAEHAFAGGALGSLLYRDTGQSDGASWLADVAVGAYLRSGGVAAAPLWSTLILPNAATAYRLPVATSTNTIGELAASGATGEYLAGATGAIPAWATLNQAAVPGLTTADSPTFAGLTLSGLSTVNRVLYVGTTGGVVVSHGNLTFNGTNFALGGAIDTAIGLYVRGAISAGNPRGFRLDTTLNPTAGTDAYGFISNPTLTIAGSGTHTLFVGFFVNTPTITAGAGTLTSAASLYIANQPSGATNNYALWVDAGVTRLDGNLFIGALTAAGTSLAGGIALASGTAPTTFPADMIQMLSKDVAGVAGSAGLWLYGELGDLYTFGDGYMSAALVRTITGAVADGYAAALKLDPGYTAATALTVTRHNYIDIQDVSVAGAGPAAVTDAAVFRFDANIGTHKALAANAAVAVTITSVGPTGSATTIQGWLKINVNGTLRYIPCW